MICRLCVLDCFDVSADGGKFEMKEKMMSVML